MFQMYTPTVTHPHHMRSLGFLIGLLPFLALMLLLLLCAAPAQAAEEAPEGRPVRPLHGPGYEHLDCSACLTVSRALFGRLNATLNENPSTYLASHRLNRANQLRRRPYRNSELLVTEVMDNFCRSYENDERTLRLHPKSKVRLYHQQVWKDVTLGVRPSLREDEVYPAGAHDPQWDNYVELRRYEIAKVYSPKDEEALKGMSMLKATPAMCATLVEEFEDEIEELVKLAHNLSDIEYGLCGLPLPGTADAAEVRATILPITNVCARTEVLRAAAHRDQLRWSQYMRREAHRLEKLAAKRKASQESTGEDAAEEKAESDHTEISAKTTVGQDHHNGDASAEVDASVEREESVSADSGSAASASTDTVGSSAGDGVVGEGDGGDDGDL